MAGIESKRGACNAPPPDEVFTSVICFLNFVIQNLLYNGNPIFVTKNYMLLFGLGFEIEKTNYRCEYFVAPASPALRGVRLPGRCGVRPVHYAITITITITITSTIRTYTITITITTVRYYYHYY